MNKFLTKLQVATVILLLITPFLSIGQSSIFNQHKLIQGDSLVFQSNGGLSGFVINPKNGVLTKTQITGGYIFKYKPNSNFEGRDTFLFNMFNNTFNYVGYVVNVANSYLESSNDYTYCAENTAIDVNVVDNDTSSTGTKVLTKVSIVNGGTATILNNSTLHFVPDNGFSGVARLYYTVCNEVGVCSESSVFIAVNSTINSDTINIFLNKNKTNLVILPNNDYTILNSPNKGGTLQSIASNAYSYSPANNYSGDEKFTFINSNGKLFHVKAKTYNTPAPNLFVANDVCYTPVSTPVTINVQNNDIDKTKFTITTYTIPQDVQSITKNGPIFTITPKANFKGTINFTYNSKYIGPNSNNAPANETGIVSVIVSDQRPIQNTYELNVIKDNPLILKNKSSLLAYSINIIDNPLHGVLSYYPGFNSISINGKVVSGYNMLIYNPSNGYVGQDSMLVEHCINGVCNNILLKTSVAAKDYACFSDCVWPGDANTDGIVDFEDALVIGRFMGKIGEERSDATYDYYPQDASNWSSLFSEAPVNYKHFDANGDGSVSYEDLTAIDDNYLKTNNLTNETFSVFKAYPFDIVTDKPGPFYAGDKVKFNLILGNSNIPAIDINGIKFSMYISPNIANADSSYFVAYNSWLTYTSAFFNMTKKPSPGKTDMVISRVGNKPASGSGIIGEFNTVVETDIAGFQSSEAVVKVTGIKIMGSDGEIYSLPDIIKPLQLLKERPALDNNQLLLMPNPTNGLVELRMNGGYLMNKIDVFNTTGQMVETIRNLNTNQRTIDLSNLSSGLYILNIQTAEGTLRQKIEVIK